MNNIQQSRKIKTKREKNVQLAGEVGSAYEETEENY